MSVTDRAHVRTAYSVKPSIDAAVAEIHAQLIDVDARLLCFFASPAYVPQEIASRMQAAFPHASTVGCTTAGEIVGGHMLKHGIVAMALDAHIVGSRPAVAVVEHVASGAGLPAAVASLEAHHGGKLSDMQVDRYIGLVLVDGMSMSEERLLDRLGDLTNVMFVGGSAGDDLAFRETFVFANGRAHRDAAILVLLQPDVPFEVLKTQSFDVLPQRLRVTRAEPGSRKVQTFDGKPAASAYAEALGVPCAEAAAHFMAHPMGLVVDGEPFVRSPQQIDGDAMKFYCDVVEGTELSLLKSRDIVEDTGAALAAAKARGPVSAILNFHCILRTLELEARDATQAYADLFRDVPTLGFSTYGEQYVGHINQTSTMVLFRE